MNALINASAFQVLWAAIVLSAAHGIDLLGAALLLAWLPMHARLSRVARTDLALFLVLALAGPLLDTLLEQLGWIRFSGMRLHPALAPLWLAALWGNFALTLNHSLRPVLERPALAILLGAIGGPLAYWAGARFGIAEFLAPQYRGLLALALIWASVMAVLGLWLKPRLQIAGASL